MQYKFRKGITDAQINQLISISKSDPTIQKFTSDPIRFKDKKSAKQWLENVTTHTLTDTDDNLIGITWLHKKPLPKREFTTKFNRSDFHITFAIRIYGEARGKGHSFDFMKKSFEDFNPGNVWIETSFDNIPTIKLAKKFGFKQVSNPNENGKIIMVYPAKRG